MGRVSVRLAWAAIALLVLCSCSAISLVDTWRNPTARAGRVQKVLVASFDKNAENRRVYEDIVVGEFSRRGIQAVPAYSLTAGNRPPNRRALLQMGSKEGADGVLIVQTVRVERQTSVQPGYISSTPDYYYPRFYPGWGSYGYGGYGYGYGGYRGYGYGGYGPYGGTTWYEPPTSVTYDVATIQANLFTAPEGNLVWAATMETMEPGRVVKVAKELAQILLKSLGKEGLL